MMNYIRRLIENPKVDIFLIILILLNCICYILQTDAAFSSRYGHFVETFEMYSIFIFSAEIIIRFSVVRSWKELFAPMMLIDILAVAPYYLSFVTFNTTILRVLRLSRVFRLAKLARYTSAFGRIRDAFSRRKDEIIVTAIIFLVGLTTISIGIYYAERSTANPTFSSIPNAFWWAVITCTSVGYGDAYPVTVVGKIIGAFAAVLGVGLHALLIGVVGAAFLEVVERKKDSDAPKDAPKATAPATTPPADETP